MQFYQMKHLIEKFHISRDTIKYYEKKGLISSVRNETGYRLYDEVNMQKLRKILNLKDMGFSLDTIETQGNDKGLGFCRREIDKIREEIEQEIIELNNRLEKLSVYEQWVFENKMYEEMFKINRDFKLCIECENIKEKYSECFYVRDLEILHLSSDGTIKNVEEKTVILSKESAQINCECKQCVSENMITFPKVYRGTWCCYDRSCIQELIDDIYERAKNLGYALGKEVYCIKKVAIKNDKDCIMFDVIIPFD
ncbi:MAG: MerR family transcriptional regulator [Erysipelotrichaceae bacterium]|nr:MerR family transcriptional regulator [Erysipelotrichaceae bacterium]